MTLLQIRREEIADHHSVEELTREAFWNLYVPGCDEHYYLHQIRKSEAFIPDLNLVAELEGKIVAHIAYTKGQIKLASGGSFPVISFGPVSVHPDVQRKSIGSQLIKYSLQQAKELGHSIVVIYGDPRYYCRFGFHCGEKYEIKTSDDHYATALQVLELQPGVLKLISGKFYEGVEYLPVETELEQFDRLFPGKIKQVTASQAIFKVMSGLRF